MSEADQCQMILLFRKGTTPEAQGHQMLSHFSISLVRTYKNSKQTNNDHSCYAHYYVLTSDYSVLGSD